MALSDADKKWILETVVPRQALENWRYDQGGKKSQAWGLIQAAAARPTVASVVTDEQVEKALRNILADLAGSKDGSGN